jgi:nucleoporin SEH1
MLSLVATAMDTVKIYRSTTAHSDSSTTPGAMPLAGPKTTFYEAARLSTHPALVRDVQWAPFNVRGFDLFATACRDGGVRIYKLDTMASTISTNKTNNNPANHPSQSSSSNNAPSSPATSTIPHRPGPQSSLTSAIVGRSGTPLNLHPSSTTTRHHSRSTLLSPFTHTITIESEILNAHRDAWALCWDPAGQVLMSSGSDGVTKLWKKAISGAGWILFADQEVTVDESDGEAGGEGDG